MNGDEISIGETTQRSLSGFLVGVGNIWARDLPDDAGVVASRMSAVLSIATPGAQQSRIEQVFAGSVFALGPDKYCVVDVKDGETSPGSIILRKLP